MPPATPANDQQQQALSEALQAVLRPLADLAIAQGLPFSAVQDLLKRSFVDFLHNLPFYGLAVLCLDDVHVRSIVQAVGRPIVSYGIAAEDAEVRAVNIRREGLQTTYDVVRPSGGPLRVTVNLPGTHNVLNSLAAIVVASELGIEDAAIQRALASFQGVERRLQHIADVETAAGRVTIIDDYGHHPTEVTATLEALRQAYPGRRIVLAFQPHRYTRTHDLIDDFSKALSTADALLITEVYAAGEAPIPGADGRAICRAVRGRGLVELLAPQQGAARLFGRDIATLDRRAVARTVAQLSRKIELEPGAASLLARRTA